MPLLFFDVPDRCSRSLVLRFRLVFFSGEGVLRTAWSSSEVLGCLSCRLLCSVLVRDNVGVPVLLEDFFLLKREGIDGRTVSSIERRVTQQPNRQASDVDRASGKVQELGTSV